MFKSNEGKELRKAIAKKSKFVPGEGLTEFRKPSGLFDFDFAMYFVRHFLIERIGGSSSKNGRN